MENVKYLCGMLDAGGFPSVGEKTGQKNVYFSSTMECMNVCRKCFPFSILNSRPPSNKYFVVSH